MDGMPGPAGAAPEPLTLAELGEFGLIARLVDRLNPPPSPAGPGDDAAVLAAPSGQVLMSTDLLAEGVHFRLDWSTGYDVGRKAAAANLADIAAMGGVPTALLVGVALPSSTPLTVVDGLIDGLRDEAATVGVAIIGGDTIRSLDRITVAVSVVGDLVGRAPVTRAASAGGQLVLAGRLGWAAAGLALLIAGDQTPDFAPLRDAHRCPDPPYALGPALADRGALAMCDVSDGLLADLGHLTTASMGGAEVNTELMTLPTLLVEAGALLGVDPWTWVLTGGDDHALLAVLPDGVDIADLAGTDRIGDLWLGAPAGVRITGPGADDGRAFDGTVGATGGNDHFRP